MGNISGKSLLVLAIAAGIGSCSLNKSFLKPDRLPENFTQMNLVNPETKDTTVFSVFGKNKQPVFLKPDKDTVQLSYTIESVMLPSASGNRINGWFMKPKNARPEITLLHFHGNGGFILSQSQAIASLLKKGFQVFTFDYSGYGFSEGKPTRDNVLKDALSVLDYVKGRPDLMNTKLVIYGQSLGGHLAAVVGQRKEAFIDGLVIEGAFTSHKDMAAEQAGFAGRLLVKEKYSAKKAIQDFHKPVLIIHSTDDEVIPFAMGKGLFEKANAPKAFYEIQKCHICGPEFYSDSISEKVRNLVKE